jgi:SAM-dependent methyltransferase
MQAPDAARNHDIEQDDMSQGYVRRTAPNLDRGKLRTAIEDAFTDLALHPHRRFHFISGPPLAARLGYTQRLLEGVPRHALESFAGVGNPFRIDEPRPGETVLDVGCGSGVDTLIAARMVGPQGWVMGVDMTAAMVERAQQCVLQARAGNVRIEWGHAESLPLPDDSVDRVISNGVVSLTPDKRDTFREIARVLKPGGRLQIADVVVQWRIPPYVSEALDLWTECIAGATWMEDYPPLLREAGFEEPTIVEIFDVFAGTVVETNSSLFRARGANISARRGG